MMLCAKFGCYWPNGSKDENVKSLQVDRQTTGNKKKNHLSFSSGELPKINSRLNGR